MSAIRYETTRTTIVRRANGNSHPAPAPATIDTRTPKLEILGSGDWVHVDGVMPIEMAKALRLIFKNLKKS